MIEFIAAEKTWDLRKTLLREGKLRPEECRFEGDDDQGAVHLGYFEDGDLIGIVTFLPKTLERFNGPGYQLRGMAVLPQYRNKGIGNLLVNFGVLYLKGQEVNYVWCNARKLAYSFYLGVGFEFVSEEFDIPGIGMHRVMYLKIS